MEKIDLSKYIGITNKIQNLDTADYIIHPVNFIWIKLLETNPQKYLEKIKTLQQQKPQEAKLLVNSFELQGWEGNHTHLLCQLVGKRQTGKHFSNPELFYGGQLENLDENLGIQILYYQYLCQVDLNFKDYYDQTPYESIIDELDLTKRKENKNFINYLQNLQEFQN